MIYYIFQHQKAFIFISFTYHKPLLCTSKIFYFFRDFYEKSYEFFSLKRTSMFQNVNKTIFDKGFKAKYDVSHKCSCNIYISID